MDEKTMIYKALDKYEFQVINYSKVRSAYKIETNVGNLCLKRIRHGRNKAENGNMLVEELNKVGFNNTAKYYKTREGNILVKNNKYIFFVTDWIDGEECNLNNIEETCKCVKLLAEFHLAANKIEAKDLKIRNNLKNWPRIFNSNQYDLERFKRKIERKKLKSEFDELYYSHIDSFSNRGMVALNFLNTSDYYRLSKEVNNNKTICHDSFYYQNIIKREEEYFIIDLDSIIFDLQVNDLGKLIRRLMFKNYYKWDFSKAKEMILAYNEVSKLSKSELEVMLALIVYPHKFWKLGKKKYFKVKNWDESKYMHKLFKLINYDELEQKFLEDYLEFLENYD